MFAAVGKPPGTCIIEMVFTPMGSPWSVYRGILQGIHTLVILWGVCAWSVHTRGEDTGCLHHVEGSRVVEPVVRYGVFTPVVSGIHTCNGSIVWMLVLLTPRDSVRHLHGEDYCCSRRRGPCLWRGLRCSCL